MQHNLFSIALAALLIVLSLGLQSHGTQLISIFPALWILFFGYFAFHRPLHLILTLSIFTALVLSQFSVLPLFNIFLVLLVFTYLIVGAKNFFKLALPQKMILMGPICFLMLTFFDISSGIPTLQALDLNILGISLLTGLAAPLIFVPLHRADRRFRLDPLDSMEIYI